MFTHLVALCFAISFACLLGAGPESVALKPGDSQAVEHTRPALKLYDLEEGLPNSNTYALLLDSKGRLWVGTQDGAAFFDGRTWTTVLMPTESPSNFVRALLETRDGALWFGTQDGGLWRQHKGAWTHFHAGNGLSSNRVNCLLETFSDQGQSILWVGTGGSGVVRLENGSWTLLDRKSGLEDGWIWKLREIHESDGTSRIWAATPKGIFLLRKNTFERAFPSIPFLNGSVNDLWEMAPNQGIRHIWATCWGQGIAHWDGNTWSLTSPKEGFPSAFPNSMGESRGRNGHPILWVGTYDRGVAWWSKGRWQFLDAGRGMPFSGINAVLGHPMGKPQVWLGSRGTGVAALDLGGWRTLNDSMNLPGKEVNCFAETLASDGQRTFWIGTNYGIWGRTLDKTFIHDQRQGLKSPVINTLLPATGTKGEQALWVGHLKGVSRLERGQWRHFGPMDGVPECMAICMLETGPPDARTLWVGTEKGLLKHQGGTWTLLTTADGLPHNWVYTLVETQDAAGESSLWVGTRGGGIGRLKQGRWSFIGGLPNPSVYKLLPMKGPDGRTWIWAGTMGGGLGRMEADKAGAQWEIFNQEKWPILSSNTILGLELDRQDGLYLLTGRGVSKLRLVWKTGVPVPERVETYSVGDGLPSMSCGFGASMLDQDGRVWVGTSRGAAVLDPSMEVPTPEPPLPALEHILVKGCEVPIRPGQCFSHTQNQIEFQFAMRAYHRGGETLFRTQLIGLETEPSPWQHEPHREYAALAAGSYRLHIWAKDYAGRTTPPVEYAFTVTPALWASWWTYAGYIVVLVSGIIVTLKIHTRALEQGTHRLKEMLAERTKALEEANGALLNHSYTDPLTDLHNRRYLHIAIRDDLTQVLRTYRNTPRNVANRVSLNRDLVFLRVDLDHFKLVNDRHGHTTGDMVLSQMARLIRANTRETDRVIRWGGEEFLIVARDSCVHDAPMLAERIRSHVAAYAFDIERPEALHCTCSIGFACFPVLFADPGRIHWEKVVDMADECLHEAKHTGRDRWVGVIPAEDLSSTSLPPTEESLSMAQMLEAGILIKHAMDSNKHHLYESME